MAILSRDFGPFVLVGHYEALIALQKICTYPSQHPAFPQTTSSSFYL